MATNYPGSADAFPNPSPTSPRNNPSLSGLISNIGDAVEALEAKVGTTGTSDPNALDFILKSTTGGHAHTGAGTDGKRVAYSSLSGVPSTFAPASHPHSQHTSIGADDHHAEAHDASKHAFSGARMNASGQSTTSATTAVVDFTTTAFDTGSYADLAGNRLNAPAGGYYRVTARATFASDSSGYRRLRLLLDGSAVLDADVRAAATGEATTLACQWTGPLTTSNKVSADVLQNANRTVQLSSASIVVEFLGTA